jgi:hypothetical protein
MQEKERDDLGMKEPRKEGGLDEEGDLGKKGGEPVDRPLEPPKKKTEEDVEKRI